VTRGGIAGRLRSTLINLANNAPLLRALSWPLLRFKPIVILGRRALVVRHADVSEVLTRDEDFTIAEVNAASMDRVNGPFVLGMDRSPLYLRERSILSSCVHEGDDERVRAFVRAAARDLVAEAGPHGRIDVVQGLARPAAVRLVAAYFGISGPDEATMLRWMRAMFYETFLNVWRDPDVRREGERSGAEFHAYTDDLIATRREQVASGHPTPDDFVTRLVRLESDPATRLGDEGIRRNLGGVVVGAVDTTSKATTHAIDQLLRHPSALAQAAEAAATGDMRTVTGFALDALRFNPLNPALARYSARPVTLAEGTRRERCIPAGRTVYVGLLPAMFDPSVFERPGELRGDRPLSSYLHFGSGLHTCFGRYVNLVQIPELVAVLLRLKGLRRPAGRDGNIAYDGPFPDRLVLEFDATPMVGAVPA
jgi:cytochrome P450